MKFSKKKIGALVGAALSFGVAGQASADVYGVSHVDIDNLLINFSGLNAAAAGVFTFSTNQDATLNGAVDPTSGAANCAGNFPSVGTCTGANPVLSGLVQNAPGSGVVRGENDYTIFGQTAEYSNAEAAIVTAVLVGDPNTSTQAISESNLQTGTSAQANTNVNSNTFLALTFDVQGDGSMTITFDALIDILAEVSGGDVGIAQANSSVGVTLQSGGVTLANWTPNGDGVVSTCVAPLICSATDPFDLNNVVTSNGTPASGFSNSGSFQLNVAGLSTGQYTLALATTTSTDLARIPQVPVPGTLLLLGTGLLLGARASRRSKS